MEEAIGDLLMTLIGAIALAVAYAVLRGILAKPELGIMRKQPKLYTDPDSGEVYRGLSTREVLVLIGIYILVMVIATIAVSGMIYVWKCLF